MKAEEPVKCKACDGYGNIWVGWSLTPVQCAYCHGTGNATNLKREGKWRKCES